MVLQPISLKRSPHPLERRDEEPVGSVAMGQSLKETPPRASKFRLPSGQIAHPKVRVCTKEILHLALVLGGADRARRVHEPPTWPHGRGSRIEDPPLERT